MTIAEPPIRALHQDRRVTGDGVHMVARSYQKGVRLDAHMHREAQLVYAASGTMQDDRPHCQNPSACGAYKRGHCYTCAKAAGLNEAAA